MATALVMLLEVLFPWRANQRFFRKDWGLDVLYLYANIFVFSVLLEGVYGVLGKILPSGVHMDLFGQFGWGWQLILFFIVQDFLQWSMHRLLHRVDWLWQFHKIHHSVQEMGVAAHFRYHWMENILYKPTKTATLALFAGVEPQQAVLVHMGTLVVGHLNHANIRLDLGILRYVFNSPTMHLLHHSHAHLAHGGVNFGITLSCWDYIFGTAERPTIDGGLKLGFDGVDEIPSGFAKQLMYPIQ